MNKLVQLYKNNQPVYVEPEKVTFFLSLPGFSQEIVTPKKVEPLPVVEKKPEIVTPVTESVPVEEVKEEKELPRRRRASILEGLE